MDRSYDAVFIGAGHNSLACAAHLANSGWRVGVFEQAAAPGGAVKTLDLTAPGFRHDWGAMNLSLFAGSAFYKRFSAELGAQGLVFAPVAKCFASVFPDATWLGVGTDLAATTARIAAISPRDAETWARLVAAFPVEAEILFGLLGMPMQKRALALFLFKTIRRKGLAGGLELLRFLLLSPRAWLTGTFESAKVQALLGAWGMHLDFAPDIAGGALFPYLEAMANQCFGMVLGKGGADTMIRAMVAMIEAKGGAVHCNTPVTGVDRDGKGVTLRDGTRIAASRAIMACTTPAALAALTGGTGDAVFDAHARGFVHAPGTMMIHLAMTDLPDWAAGAELRDFAYVHVAPSLDQMARTYAQATAGLLPDEPVIVVGQPTAVDPSRAPPGRHVLWVQVRMVPGEIRGDAGGTIASADWPSAKDPYAERVLDIIERYAPGTRAKIIARHVVSPLELQADNPNLVGGDQICGSHHLSQHFLFRPQAKTPIKGVYLIGAATWPGAGVGAGSGYNLSHALTGA